MKKKIFTIFGSGLIIGAAFFGGYVLSAPIQEKVGLHILNRIAPSDLWLPAWSINLAGGGTSFDNILAMSPALLDNVSGGVRQAGTPGFDGQSPGDGIQAMNNMLFNDTDYDRGRGISADTLTSTVSLGIPLSAQLSTWSITNSPANGSNASATKAAGAAGVRHVATGITACISIDEGGGNPDGTVIALKDGATVIRTWFIGVSAMAETKCENVSGMAMTGTAATAMTIDSSSNNGVDFNNFITVTLTGFSVQ